MKKGLFTAGFLALTLTYSVVGTAATIGTLTWDEIGNDIIDANTGNTYLQLGLLASLTYQQTIDITSSGALYQDYHIASQTEAYAFYNAVIPSTVTDILGYQLLTTVTDPFTDGALGNNYTSINDFYFFLSDESREVGLGYLLSTDNNANLADEWSSIAYSDGWSSDGAYAQHISWLLVGNANLIATPIPAAAFMFAPALLSFLGFRRKIRA